MAECKECFRPRGGGSSRDQGRGGQTRRINRKERKEQREVKKRRRFFCGFCFLGLLLWLLLFAANTLLHLGR
jgi:hypothetical protein